MLNKRYGSLSDLNKRLEPALRSVEGVPF